jgi:hypothetical protein
MEKLVINKKAELFTAAEVDYIICALIKYQTELRGRTHLMERFADREHLERHAAKILLGEKILNDFQ